MILDIVNVNFIYGNLDKLFNINFMMLAFIITAITILQTLQGGRVEEFKATGLFDDVIRYYNSSIKWNFISGSLICILWFLRCEFKIYQIIVCILSKSKKNYNLNFRQKCKIANLKVDINAR